MPASAGDAAQRAYEAVTMHLSLARSCGADAYERAKSEAQETLDAGGYTQGTAADLIAMIEATAAVASLGQQGRGGKERRGKRQRKGERANHGDLRVLGAA